MVGLTSNREMRDNKVLLLRATSHLFQKFVEFL